MIDKTTSTTGVTYNCFTLFNSEMPTWAGWDNPWMFRVTGEGWDKWLAEDSRHQVVLAADLIPKAVSDNKDPLTWERACAAGDYDQYATTLARNLVSDGAGNTVIRLGVEANGNWEDDYVGTSAAEMSDWAQCYDREVTAMRAVAGEHFLFVWNPNICTANIPISKWYPGDAYVDIVGADVYDLDCETDKSVAQEGWQAFSTDDAIKGAGNPDFPSLVNLEAFAVAHDKPMSLPEWGLTSGKPDDADFVVDLAQMFKSDDFAFESYFDNDDDNIAALGSAIPQATAAYQQAFR